MMSLVNHSGHVAIDTLKLFPRLSALDNVAFSPKIKGVAKAERQAKACDLLERVALGHLAERFGAGD